MDFVKWHLLCCAGRAMTPLLITGITSIASNLLDHWRSRVEQRADVSGPDFAALLQRATSAEGPGAVELAGLARELMAAPEVRAALDGADPARVTGVELSAAGDAALVLRDGTRTPIQLSQTTQRAAHALAALACTREPVVRVSESGVASLSGMHR